MNQRINPVFFNDAAARQWTVFQENNKKIRAAFNLKTLIYNTFGVFLVIF